VSELGDDGGAPSGATLGERVGDLRDILAEERRARLPRYELPDERTVVTFEALAARVGRERRVAVTGAHGSAAALAARALVRSGRRVLLITSDVDSAQHAHGDLRFVLGAGASALLYSHNDTSPYADVNPDRRAAQLRMATLAHLTRGLPFDALVAPVGALARKVVPRDVVEDLSELVQVDQELDRDAFVGRLVEAGYVRAPVVEDPGAIAIRGSILDVWSPAAERPARIELFGDAVLAIKQFDVETQRTLADLRELYLCPAREAPMTAAAVARAREQVRALCDAMDIPSNKARLIVEDVASGRAFFGADGFLPAFVEPAPLWEYLPDDLVVMLEDPPALTRALRDELGRAGREGQALGRQDAGARAAVRSPPPLGRAGHVGRPLADRRPLGRGRTKGTSSTASQGSLYRRAAVPARPRRRGAAAPRVKTARAFVEVKAALRRARRALGRYLGLVHRDVDARTRAATSSTCPSTA
jgi:transcription-repair coupling factor (superfamily II helicase)